VIPVATGFWLAGRTCRDREAAIAQLAARNADIAAQRERTAALAVRADRARIEHGLGEAIGAQIAGIAAAASTGRDCLTGTPEMARAALARIARNGRDTLTRMRDVVGALREDRSTAPQPGLAELPALVARASGGGQLRVVEPRQGANGGTQLAVYRIVEHLLHEVAGPAADVEVRFGADLLTVRVSGAARLAGAPGEIAAARQWVALYGGTMNATTRGDLASWVVAVPVGATGV
jgi:hypothetical protein